MSPEPICANCKHLLPKLVEPGDDTSLFTCKAYPKGIPDRWLLEEHDEVQDDQVGTYVLEE